MPEISDSSNAIFRAVKEVTFGVTPAVPMIELPFTGHTLAMSTESASDESITGDRQNSRLIRVGATTAGDVNQEVKYGGIDLLLEGAMQNVFAAEVSTTLLAEITTVASDNSVNSATSELPVVAADSWVQMRSVVGVTTTYGKVVSSTSAKMVLSHIVLADATITAGTDPVIVSGGNMTNGATATSYSMETEYTDMVTTLINHVGVRVNTFALEVTSKSKVTSTFGLMGLDTATASATIGTGTPTAAVNTTTMSASTNVGTVLQDGTPASVYFKKISLSMNNNCRVQDAVANMFAVGISGNSSLNVMVSAEAYFSDKTFYEKYINNDTMSLMYTLDGVDGGSYLVEIPTLSFKTATVNPSGKNVDNVVPVELEASKHTTLGYTIQICRFAA